LARLRSRLAFDASPEALAEGAAAIEKELQEYAHRAAHYVALHGTELRRTVDALETIVKSIAQRQDFYGARLRQFAAQLETTPYPTDPEHLSEVVALQAAGLLGCVESMANDTQSLMSRMREELAAVSQRLKDAEMTDYVTGLMNRREMERRIEERKAAGEEPVIVVFELSGDVRDEVAQEVAARLDSQFRHQDLVCRWTDHEFLVLFQGTREMAQSRTEQVVPWIAGKYPLNNGESVEIRVDAGLVAPHLLAMQ
jgi:GGDEF domain-containing protein